MKARITGAPAKRDPEASLWGQCSGYSRDWTGPTICQSTATCVRYNDWYSEWLRASDMESGLLTLLGRSGWCSPLPEEGPWTTTRGQPCMGSAECVIATYVYSDSVWSCKYRCYHIPSPPMVKSRTYIYFVARCAATSVFSPSTSTPQSTVFLMINISISVTSAPTRTSTLASLYGQCGGSSYLGPTACAEGSCKYFNDWFSE